MEPAHDVYDAYLLRVRGDKPFCDLAKSAVDLEGLYFDESLGGYIFEDSLPIRFAYIAEQCELYATPVQINYHPSFHRETESLPFFAELSPGTWDGHARDDFMRAGHIALNEGDGWKVVMINSIGKPGVWSIHEGQHQDITAAEMGSLGAFYLSLISENWRMEGFIKSQMIARRMPKTLIEKVTLEQSAVHVAYRAGRITLEQANQFWPNPDLPYDHEII
ncbi:hypothetical protein ACYPKM_00915 [Pseudomonas aeruginosa]